MPRTRDVMLIKASSVQHATRTKGSRGQFAFQKVEVASLKFDDLFKRIVERGWGLLDSVFEVKLDCMSTG